MRYLEPSVRPSTHLLDRTGPDCNVCAFMFFHVFCTSALLFLQLFSVRPAHCSLAPRRLVSTFFATWRLPAVPAAPLQSGPVLSGPMLSGSIHSGPEVRPRPLISGPEVLLMLKVPTLSGQEMHRKIHMAAQRQGRRYGLFPMASQK